MKRNPTCTLCMLHEHCCTKCLWGRGNPKAKLMLVGEAPGGTEDRLGKPFVGEAGRLLSHVLKSLCINEDGLYITNVIKCRPQDNKLPLKKQLRECWTQCRGYLEHEMITVKPKVVLFMGGTALELYEGRVPITKWEGLKIRRGVYASLHPAYILHAPSKEIRLAQAIATAATAAGIKVSPKAGEIFKYDIRS